MLKTSRSRFLIGILMALLVSFNVPVAFATPASVDFEVGANDFPDHKDYNKIELVPNAFVNVYTISNDSTLGYYKGTLKETLETGNDGIVPTTVAYGDMVNFLTFKSKTLAQSSTYSTYKFTTPPYKNFGNKADTLCQTNFFAFDQYLKNDQNYACAISLSTPYTGGSDSVSLGTPTITSPYSNQVLTNYPREAYIGWTSVSNATSYEAEVACDTCTSTTTKWLNPSTFTSSTNYLTTTALAGDNGFRVRVRAANGSTKGSWSDYVYFSYSTAPTAEGLATPYITSPYSNQVLTNYPRTAYISWTKVSNASSYEAEVACDTCTSTTTKWLNPSTFTSSTNYLTTKALAGDNGFRVRVRAINDSTKGSWSDYVYFSYNTSSYSNESLGTPKITSPYANQVLTNYPREAYIGWTSVSNASSYDVEMTCDVCVSSTTKWLNPSVYTSNTNYLTTVPLAGDNEFRVRVRASKDSSTKGSWSDYVYFSYNTSGYIPGSSVSSTSGNTLPPAGYEDDVLTKFDSYKNPFSDTSLTTLEGQAAAELYRRGVIGGFADGEFKGDRLVNRAELAKFLLLARYGSVSDVSNNGQFNDVLDGAWYVKFVVTAANKGIIKGYADGSFKPGNPVNVAEFLKMLTMTFDLKTNLPYSYLDVASDSWYAQFAGAASNYGLFPKKIKYLNPGYSMTRNEVAVAIYEYLLNK